MVVGATASDPTRYYPLSPGAQALRPSENPRSHDFVSRLQTEEKAPRERMRARIPLKHMILQSLPDMGLLSEVPPRPATTGIYFASTNVSKIYNFNHWNDTIAEAHGSATKARWIKVFSGTIPIPLF